MLEKLTAEAWHKKQAIECFNGTWDLIDNKERTEADNLKMVRMAHTSRHHWDEIGSEEQWATGEWQISRVYILVGNGNSALLHGLAALNYCEAGKLEPFSYAFAYEAIARAYKLLGDTAQKKEYTQKAKEIAETIEDKEDKEYFLGELNNI